MSDNFFVRCGRKELGDNHLRLMVLGVILLLSHVLGNIAQAEQLSWAKQAGGTKADIGVSIAADGGGYSYVTGSYSDTATFGDGNSQVTFTNLGGTHLFVAKYDTGGGLVWVKDARARFDEYHNIMVLGVSIALDANGNIYVTGGFWDTATFGPGEATETSITSAGSSDIFVAKYNSGGGLVWVKQGGGASTEFGRSIAVDENGDSYVTGYFLGTVTFGEAGTTQTTITSGGAYAIFVAKYDGDGGLVWVKQAGGETSENSADATGIALDGSGNVYVTGEFLYTATFGPGEATETTLVSGASNDADLFVAKYNSGGGLVWAKRAGAYGAHERGQGIGLDGSGNIYVVGNFNGTTVFGPGEPNETTLACDCDSSDTTFFDLFVAKYNSGGGLVWAKRAGGPGSDDGRSIAVDDNGNSYVSGTFYGTATFGSGELSETTLSAGSPDIGDLFVAKYDSGGGLVWAKQAEGTSPFGISGNGVALDGSGNVYVTGQFGDTATIGPGEPNATTLVSAGSLDLFVAKYVYSSGETPAGNNISVIPEDPNPVVPGVKIKVEFFEVTDSGVTTVTSSQSGTPPPTGFSLGDPPVYFDIKTTAKFEGLIKICIDYTGISFPNESLLRLYHQAVEGNWENVTISLDTSKDIICGVVSSLSPFAVFEATYQFVGFFSPVQTGDGTVNLAKAGSVIPLKWQLLDKQGAFITDTKVVTGIYTEKIACSNSALLNDIDETLSSGSSGLHYDFTSNQYVYAWKTDKKWAGKCFRLKLELFKSYKYSADFQMW